MNPNCKPWVDVFQFQSVVEPLPDVPVYLYAEAGDYMNLNPTTDADGQVVFNLPDQAYIIRADYMNQQLTWFHQCLDLLVVKLSNMEESRGTVNLFWKLSNNNDWPFARVSYQIENNRVP